jgi:Ca2+-binding EF-hand superfamily protein
MPQSTVIFSCYDFDGTGKLTIDELTLALKVSE